MSFRRSVRNRCVSLLVEGQFLTRTCSSKPGGLRRAPWRPTPRPYKSRKPRWCGSLASLLASVHAVKLLEVPRVAVSCSSDPSHFPFFNFKKGLLLRFLAERQDTRFCEKPGKYRWRRPAYFAEPPRNPHGTPRNPHGTPFKTARNPPRNPPRNLPLRSAAENAPVRVCPIGGRQAPALDALASTPCASGAFCVENFAVLQGLYSSGEPGMVGTNARHVCVSARGRRPAIYMYVY